MNQQQVTLRVNDSVTYIEGRLEKTTYSALRKVLGFEDQKALWRAKAVQKRFNGKSKWANTYDGFQTTICYHGKCRCSIPKSGIHFPTGLVSKSIEFFNESNIGYSIQNERSAKASNAGYSMSNEFEGRDYQQTIIYDACNRERGIIKVATGGGKTGIASGVIAQIGAEPTVFYVTSKDLLKQAKDEIERFVLKAGLPIQVGQAGGGKCDIKDITVMTVQTAVKALGHKFARYDDEEKSSDSTKLNDKNKKEIADFIRGSKVMVCDECVTGDALIMTREDGLVKMSDLSEYVGRDVQSFDDNSVVWKKVTHFYRKGTKPIVNIKLTNRMSIRCTSDHLIKTQLGWIPAGRLTQSDQVMCFANSVECKNFCQNVFNTEYVNVESVESCGEEDVFDITVEDTHCFFANNLLVHNCQHWAAKTCQIISDSSQSARYRFGFSATPWRDEGDDMLIDGCFGKTIADINASFLIERGYLVKPTIYFVHTKKAGLAGAYSNVYTEGISENQERNLMISSIAQKMVDAGRQVLILIKIIEHGQTLEAMIPNSFFVNGSHSATVRSEWLDKMRRREAPITIATSIFDEGVDVKPLDGLILGGSGKSQTRALQRIGRVIRTYSDPNIGYVKQDAFVVDFHDNMKYMLSHSRQRRRIYSTESEFIIKDWK